MNFIIQKLLYKSGKKKKKKKRFVWGDRIKVQEETAFGKSLLYKSCSSTGPFCLIVHEKSNDFEIVPNYEIFKIILHN